MKRFEGVFIGNGSNPIGRRKNAAYFGKIWRENWSTRAPHFRSGPLHLASGRCAMSVASVQLDSGSCMCCSGRCKLVQ